MNAVDFRHVFNVLPFLAQRLAPAEWRAICLTCRDWHLYMRTAEFAIDWGYDNDAPLRAAAAAGNLDEVRFLLSKPLVNATALNNAPLTLACLGGHMATVEALLALPHVSARVEALAGAMIKRHNDVVESLVSSGKVDFQAEPEIQGADKLTRAAKEHALPVLLVLSIEAGDFPNVFQKVYDLKATDMAWFPILFRMASHKSRHSIVLYLLHRHLPAGKPQDNGIPAADLEHWCKAWLKSDTTTLEEFRTHFNVVSKHISIDRIASLALRRDRPDLFQSLVNDGQLQLSNKFVMDAARHGALGVLKFLVHEQKLDPLARSQKPFRVAIERRQAAIVDWLLSEVPGIDPSINDNVPIRLASQSGDATIVRRLLDEPGVSAYACDNLPLRHAAEHGYEDVVRLLLERGGRRVDPRSNNGAALYKACVGGHAKAVAALLEDARVEVTPRAATVASSHPEVLQLLVAKSPDILDSIEDRAALIRGLIAGGQTSLLKSAVGKDAGTLRDVIWEFFERIPKIRQASDAAVLLKALSTMGASEECRPLVPTNELLRLINFIAKYEQWEALATVSRHMRDFAHHDGQIHSPAKLQMELCRKFMRSENAPRELSEEITRSVVEDYANEITSGFRKEVEKWQSQ